jgi:3-hydroxyisobutyrate dehydrogenase-like beta-hydroxyacid dehydrogenase
VERPVLPVSPRPWTNGPGDRTWGVAPGLSEWWFGRYNKEGAGMSEVTGGGGAARQRVGFAGLGTMGALMAANLAREGFALTVWNRTPGRDQALLDLGATRAASPAELARSCDVVVTCLTDSPQVEAVLFGPDGLVEGLAPGSLLIDCSTISPVKAAEFEGRLASLGCSMLDAPVSGGTEGARLGTLTIMVGGQARDVERAQEVLAAMGQSVTHLGPVGAGQWAKAINQVILSGVYLAVAEGVTLGLKAGLDVEKVLGALKGGAAGSWVLSNRSERMVSDVYPLGFKISLHRKDLAIALELAREVGAVLPVTSLAATFEDGLIAQGYGDDDNSALARPIRWLSGL